MSLSEFQSVLNLNSAAAKAMKASHGLRKKQLLQTFGLGILSAVLTAPTTVLGAEQVSIFYGPLEFSLPVTSLEAYVRSGKIDSNLAFYAKQLPPQELVQLRQILQDRIELNSITIAQFLYSSFGESSLQFLGEFIQTDSGLNGFYAIRAALILAAADPQGLTLLNLLKKFPTKIVRIESTKALQVVSAYARLFEQTSLAIAAIERQSIAEASTEPRIKPTQLLSLQRPGRWKWQKVTLGLNDRRRDRRFSADLYLPKTHSPAPVLIFSHGLGGDRQNFAALVQHLASHGFAVAAIEHPGSDRQQLQSLLRGAAREAAEPSEFFNRPLDVSYLLDDLFRLNQSQFNGSLDLQRVGAIGYSFGGYTVLALAGAKLNFSQLKQTCSSDTVAAGSMNVSLLLQCLALDLPPGGNYSLQDKRIRAVIGLNPMTSSIFGQQGLRQIRVPVMFVAGSDDVITPALLEQICPFTWLTSSHKYLALILGGTHLYSDRSTAGMGLPLPSELVNSNPSIVMHYLKAMSLVFAKTYVANEKAFQSYLQASSIRAMSQVPLKLRLVDSLLAAQLSPSPNFTCSAINASEP